MNNKMMRGLTEDQVLEMLLDLHLHQHPPLIVSRRYGVSVGDLNILWRLFGEQINIVYRIWVLKRNVVALRQENHDLRKRIGAYFGSSNN